MWLPRSFRLGCVAGDRWMQLATGRPRHPTSSCAPSFGSEAPNTSSTAAPTSPPGKASSCARCWHRGPAEQDSFLFFTPSTTASSEAAVSSRRFSPSAGHHLCTSRRDISRFSPHIQVDRIFSWKALNPFFGAQDEGFSEFRSR